jgi:hypothetical protein
MNITKLGTSWKRWKGDKTYIFSLNLLRVRREIKSDMLLGWIKIKVGKHHKKNKFELLL